MCPCIQPPAYIRMPTASEADQETAGRVAEGDRATVDETRQKRADQIDQRHDDLGRAGRTACRARDLSISGTAARNSEANTVRK